MMDRNQAAFEEGFQSLSNAHDAANAAMAEKLAAAASQAAAGKTPDFNDMVPQGMEVKNLAAQSKKNLAREVIRLRNMLLAYRAGVEERVASAKPSFGHREAFAFMRYDQTNAAEGKAPERLWVWNSRDGVTPFIVHIGDKTFQHDIKSMQGPFFDMPQGATHRWETRTQQKALEAMGRTLDLAVKMGRIEPDRAEAMRGKVEVARDWNYFIGLRDLTTGNYTDEDVTREALHGDKAAANVNA